MKMNVLLVAAAALVAFLGIAHSYLGERYILERLFRRGNLAELFRRPEFTRRTLRLAWHIMSVLAFGFTALLVALASEERAEIGTLCRIMSVTFALCGVLSVGISRGRHLSWVVFFAIAALVWMGQG